MEEMKVKVEEVEVKVEEVGLNFHNNDFKVLLARNVLRELPLHTFSESR